MSDPVDGSGRELAFIVGNYRSGSTWLLHLLSLHPEIRGVHESHLFALTAEPSDLAAAREQLFSTVPWSYGGVKRWPRYWLRQRLRPLTRHLWGFDALGPSERPHYLLDLPRERRRALSRTLGDCKTADALCRAYFDFLWTETGSPRFLVEKTSDHLFHVDRIRRVFPECRLLAIHRDGRDVVTSDRFFSRSLHRSWSLERSAHAWRRQIEAERAAVDGHGLFSLSYEALQERGFETVTAVLRYLGLTHGPEIVESLLRRSSFHFHTGREPGRERRWRHARKGIVGDWRHHLSEDEERLFEKIAGGELAALGYVDRPPAPRSAAGEPSAGE